MLLRRTVEFEKRQALRRKIARHRRRLDRRVNVALNGISMLRSLSTWITKHPGQSLLFAGGLGMLFAWLATQADSVAEMLTRLPKGDMLARRWRALVERFRPHPTDQGRQEPQGG